MVVNLALLGTFKYFNFFVQSFRDIANLFGLPVSDLTLQITLPVGISFFTFQAMSYTIDVYRKRISATTDPIAFAAFVAFFPQLVAGPIERASRLLPQFLGVRSLSWPKIQEGGYLILWGYLQKVLIADNLATVVERGYHPNASGALALLATYAFAFQIYCDFAGYSNIARGVARLFGIELMQNFNSPYLATSLQDFWRRWHISLSTWFRDYVYIPLGGNRVSKFRQMINVILTFGISGLWHGADIRFILWGICHGAGFFVGSLFRSNDKQTNHTHILIKFLRWLVVFNFVTFVWILFRAKDTSAALTIMNNIFTMKESGPNLSISDLDLQKLFFLGGGLMILEIFRHFAPKLSKLSEYNWLIRAFVIGLTIVVIMLLGKFDDAPFIYFQF